MPERLLQFTAMVRGQLTCLHQKRTPLKVVMPFDIGLPRYTKLFEAQGCDAIE